MAAFDPRQLQGRARAPAYANDSPPAGVDVPRLLRWRLAQTRAQMTRQGMDACLLFDAVNIRYACGARNMQIFTSRNPTARYLFVPAQGDVVLFEFAGCEHLAAGALVNEVLPAVAVSYVAAASRQLEQCKKWGDAVESQLRKNKCGRRVGMEAASHLHASEMRRRGYEVLDAQSVMERARAKKSPDELACIRHSLAVTEAAVATMREALRPGITENQLWALLHQHIIANNGDYIETRLLASGARAHPWFQECSPKPIAGGELVALDTDVVGPGGYYADFSRTFFAGGGKPTGRQKTLYKMAFDEVQHNMQLCRPGASFREIGEKAWKIPQPFVDNRYFVVAHGVGMTGEYPYILHAMDFAASGYDGVLQPNTTLCVESYIGEPGNGVKLEEQILVTETGCERLSAFPWDEALLGREF